MGIETGNLHIPDRKWNMLFLYSYETALEEKLKQINCAHLQLKRKTREEIIYSTDHVIIVCKHFTNVINPVYLKGRGFVDALFVEETLINEI